MIDLIDEFRRYTFRRNALIVSMAILSALSINVILFGTDAGQSLRASVTESVATPITRPPYDLTLTSAGTGSDMLLLRTNTDMTSVQTFRATLLTDPANTIVTGAFSDRKNVHIITNGNIPGVMEIITEFSTPEIFHTGDILLHINYTRTSKEPTRINLIDTEFRSPSGVYLLTNNSIDL